MPAWPLSGKSFCINCASSVFTYVYIPVRIISARYFLFDSVSVKGLLFDSLGVLRARLTLQSVSASVHPRNSEPGEF